MNDGVLIERLEPMLKERGGIVLTDEIVGNGPILRRGKVLACGPGRWVAGTWWKKCAAEISAMRAQVYPDLLDDGWTWEWLPGYRETLDVNPGDRVLFNARWNDFAHDELRGTGSDKSGPLERPLPIGFDPMIHLVQEADIAGRING